MTRARQVANFDPALFATDVPVAHGGTGASTHTANNVLIGAGTSAITNVAPGADGQVLTSTGTVWQSEAAAGGIDCDADSWYGSLRASTSFSSAVIDMEPHKLGSNVTESGGRYTCATAGWYLIFAGLQNYGNTSSACSVFLRKNTTATQHQTAFTYSATNISHYAGKTSVYILELAADDIVDLYGEGWLSGNNLSPYTGIISYFSGVRLGA